MSLEFTRYNAEVGIDKGTLKGITEICAKITAQSKQLAPVKDGYLKGSLGYKTKEINTNDLQINVKNYDGYVGSPLDYATYQEFGTRKMDAQPFLRPAVDIIHGSTADNAMQNAINSEINTAVRTVRYKERYK